MNTEQQNAKNAKIKSGIITTCITLVLLLLLWFFKLYTTPTFPPYEEIAIDFGTLTDGEGYQEPIETVEEPAPSASSSEPTQELSEPNINESLNSSLTNDKEIKSPIVKKETKKTEAKKVSVIKKETKKKETKKSTKKSPPTKSKVENKSKSNNTSNNKNSSTSKSTSKSNGKAKSIADMFAKGKSDSKSQGNSTDRTGNSGDPSGKGESIGNGQGQRNLVGFIPGTLNRSNEPNPDHNCGNERGTIIIKYTINKSGDVTSAYRISGTTQPCIVNTAISWVKKYVKAEPGNSNSVSSTYKITF